MSAPGTERLDPTPSSGGPSSPAAGPDTPRGSPSHPVPPADPSTGGGPATPTGRVKLLRLKGLIPLALFLVMLVAVWLLLLDTIVRRGVEEVGAQITGAKVDVAAADVSLFRGVVRLQGIQAADPDAPMTNMVEIGEVVADIRVAPLLRRKVIIDTVAIRNVRFGTPRETSGELPVKGRTTGAVARRITGWADRYTPPALSLEGIASTVDVSTVRTENLVTVQLANSIPAAADSVQEALTSRIRSLDVQAEIDSAKALAKRLEGASLRSLGLSGLRDAATGARNVLRGLDESRQGLSTLKEEAERGVQELRQRLERLDNARDIDYRSARQLLNIPSLEAPDIGPSLFGEMARERLEPWLRHLDQVGQYMPPGLKQRSDPGPERIRMPGTDVHFPVREALPAFLLGFAEVSLDLGDEERPERYRVVVSDITSDPAVLGRPARLSMDRVAGSAGQRRIRAEAIMDRTTEVANDSINVVISGTRLPEVSMGSLSGRLGFGVVTQRLVLSRSDERIDARLSIEAPAVQWESTGTRSGLENFVWETLTALRRVNVDVRLRGTLQDPDLSVRSNVADELAAGLQQRLGDEIRRAEAQVRAEVDRRVNEAVTEARTRVAAVQQQADGRIAELESQFEEAKQELDRRIRDLTRLLPGGIIPPE